jgi:hypothetical protein
MVQFCKDDVIALVPCLESCKVDYTVYSLSTARVLGKHLQKEKQKFSVSRKNIHQKYSLPQNYVLS